MVKITDEMKEVSLKSQGWALATVSKEGIPNVIAVGCVKIISDNEILLADNFMNKTEKNIKANPLSRCGTGITFGAISSKAQRGLNILERCLRKQLPLIWPTLK